MIFPEAGVIRDLWHKRNTGKSVDVNAEICMQNTKYDYVHEIMFKNNFCLLKVCCFFYHLHNTHPLFIQFFISIEKNILT